VPNCQRVVEHRGSGEQEGQREELHHALGALGDVADLLGEADDLDLEAGVLVAGADILLQPLGEGQVVELLAALRVVLEQVGDHHRAAAVVGDQAAHVAADQGIVADARDLVRRELVGRDVAADDVLGAEAFLRDFQHAGGRRPERGDGAPVDAGEEHHGLRDPVQALQALGGPDLALARMHHDDDAVGAEHLVAVLVEGLDVLVALRQLLVEAGVHLQLDGEHRHQQGEGEQRAERRRAASEKQVFEPLDQ